MIASFGNADAERLWATGHSRRLPVGLCRRAVKKLLLLHRATSLQDLAALPGNRLEALSRDRKGQYSIRINDQYRICFVWRDGDAYNVEVVDDH